MAVALMTQSTRDPGPSPRSRIERRVTGTLRVTGSSPASSVTVSTLTVWPAGDSRDSIVPGQTLRAESCRSCGVRGRRTVTASGGKVATAASPGWGIVPAGAETIPVISNCPR